MVTRKGNKGRRKSYYIQHNELLTEIILQIHWWLFTIDSWIVLPVRHLGQHTQLFLTWWKRIYRRKGWIWENFPKLTSFWKIITWITFDWSANQYCYWRRNKQKSSYCGAYLRFWFAIHKSSNYLWIWDLMMAWNGGSR